MRPPAGDRAEHVARRARRETSPPAWASQMNTKEANELFIFENELFLQCRKIVEMVRKI